MAMHSDLSVSALPECEWVRSGTLRLAVYRWPKPWPKADRREPRVVLVHGYPDSAAVWVPVAEKLAADHEVIAFDVRGAGQSDVPDTVKGYAIEHLMTDLGAVLDRVSPDRPVHLVAHDWGSIACWEAATTMPLQNRIASYTSMSGPSLDHVGYWLRRRWAQRSPSALAELWRQLRASWYVFFFHIPVLAPKAWTLGFDRLWPGLVARLDGTDLPGDPHLVKDGSNGLSLYRANVFQRLARPQPRLASMPVQLIVPTLDPFVSPALLDDIHEWAPALTRREIKAGHWAQVSHPDELTDHVKAFIKGVEQRGAIQGRQATRRSARVDKA